MSFWIRNKEKVEKKWRIVATFIYYTWLMLFILRMIVRMRDKANSEVSSFQSIITLGAISFLGLYFLLNIVHWLKPKWFEDRNLKISQEEEMNNQNF